TAAQINSFFTGSLGATNYAPFFNSTTGKWGYTAFFGFDGNEFTMGKPLFYNATVPYYYGNQHTVKIPGGELGIDSTTYTPENKLFSVGVNPNIIGDTINGRAQLTVD